MGARLGSGETSETVAEKAMSRDSHGPGQERSGGAWDRPHRKAELPGLADE